MTLCYKLKKSYIEFEEEIAIKIYFLFNIYVIKTILLIFHLLLHLDASISR